MTPELQALCDQVTTYLMLLGSDRASWTIGVSSKGIVTYVVFTREWESNGRHSSFTPDYILEVGSKGIADLIMSSHQRPPVAVVP
jgi:hypothetical protein